jgi:hypothetical protein
MTTQAMQTLTAEERSLLSEILANETSSLRQELYHSEAPAFRDSLKRRQALLEALKAKLV